MIFDRPWLLLLLALCIPALLARGARNGTTPSLLTLPPDLASRATDTLLRLLAAAPIAAIAIGLAGPHIAGQPVRHTGQGAHIAIVLDRSLSMDEGFALRGEKARETKGQAAVRLLTAFFAARPHDSFSLTAFSTAPIPAMPLTDHRDAIAASLAAQTRPGLANTDIGAGLALALAGFDQDDPDAAHVLLLVTDGAGAIPPATRDLLRAQAARHHARLYYLYLRAGDDPPLADTANGDTDLDKPAGLGAFFATLGIPYAGFEARDPDTVARAVARIGALEMRPLTYFETPRRLDLDLAFYACAAVGLALGLGAQALGG